MSVEFFKAIMEGDQLKVELYLDQEPALVHARNEQDLSAMLAATDYGEPAIANLLPERGATQNGQIEMGEQLLTHDAEINTRRRILLPFAIEKSQTATIAYLQQHEAVR